MPLLLVSACDAGVTGSQNRKDPLCIRGGSPTEKQSDPGGTVAPALGLPLPLFLQSPLTGLTSLPPGYALLQSASAVVSRGSSDQVVGTVVKAHLGPDVSEGENLEGYFPSLGWDGLAREGVGTWDRAPVLTLPLPADPICPSPASFRATSLPLPELRRGTSHLTASGALYWAERGRRAGHSGLWPH